MGAKPTRLSATENHQTINAKKIHTYDLMHSTPGFALPTKNRIKNCICVSIYQTRAAATILHIHANNKRVKGTTVGLRAIDGEQQPNKKHIEKYNENAETRQCNKTPCNGIGERGVCTKTLKTTLDGLTTIISQNQKLFNSDGDRDWAEAPFDGEPQFTTTDAIAFQ